MKDTGKRERYGTGGSAPVEKPRAEVIEPHWAEKIPRDEWLGGLLSVLKWMRPVAARNVPRWVWERVGVHPPTAQADEDPHRVVLLDSRDWFGAQQDR